MKTIKDRLFALYEERLMAAFPELRQAAVRRCADELATAAATECSEAVKGFSELYRDLSNKSEQHKLLFREHIELISKHSDILMAEMQQNNFVQVKSDKVTHKKYLVGKTIFANGLIKFITELNESVRRFYTDVYEIKDEREARAKGFNQTSLF